MKSLEYIHLEDALACFIHTILYHRLLDPVTLNYEECRELNITFVILVVNPNPNEKFFR